jgi:hypothetical protein
MLAVEKADAVNFPRRQFADVDIEVMRDIELSVCEKTVFAVICTHVDAKTRKCNLLVKTIAQEAGCSIRSVQESLKALDGRGVIERIECFVNGKQTASTYKIIGYRALCYKNMSKNTLRKGK